MSKNIEEQVNISRSVPVCNCPAGPHVCGISEWLKKNKGHDYSVIDE